MKKVRYFISEVLLSIILVLIVLICSKKDIKLKNMIYTKVYSTNISFGYLNNIYSKYLGKIIPFNINIDKPVFNQNLTYNSVNKYLDGCILKVDSNYLVPTLEAGLIVFIGEKEGYGNTIIIEGENGIEIWYSNIANISVSLYDYIGKGMYLGETIDDKLYLVFKQNGEVINYEEYLK